MGTLMGTVEWAIEDDQGRIHKTLCNEIHVRCEQLCTKEESTALTYRTVQFNKIAKTIEQILLL